MKRRVLLAGLTLLPLLPRITHAATTTVEIDHTKRYQVVEGFGTCINTWHADVATAYQQDDWARFYLDTLGASALRIELWAGVAQTPRERWQDITWRDFNFQGPSRRATITVDVAKRLLSLSQGSLRIIATAWTPPAWMKVNGSLGNGHPKRKNFALNLDNPVERGDWVTAEDSEEGRERYSFLGRNKLRRDRYLHFAKYLVEWSRYLESEGIRLYALSPTNEPRFSHWFESCVHTPNEYAELLETVTWMFANQGEPPIPIFGPEHMTWDIAGNKRYLDALVRRHGNTMPLAALASHGYIDGYRADLRKESTSEFRELAEPAARKIWVTEGGFGGHQWPAPLHQLGAAFLYALRDGGVSLLTPWQTLTRHPPDANGLMSLHGPTKKTYVAMHFWRFIRPGMVRIAASGGKALDTVAFQDIRADTIIVVLLNRTQFPTTALLDIQNNQRLRIEEFFVTNESLNCERIIRSYELRHVRIPQESLVTLVLAK